MQDAIAQAEDICEPPEYLPKEDDHNNIEYKFYMCNITFNKLEKRHTQMSYRLNVSWFFAQILSVLHFLDHLRKWNVQLLQVDLN